MKNIKIPSTKHMLNRKVGLCMEPMTMLMICCRSGEINWRGGVLKDFVMKQSMSPLEFSLGKRTLSTTFKSSSSKYVSKHVSLYLINSVSSWLILTFFSIS